MQRVSYLRARSAFTLIELIVAMSILIILAALIFPVLRTIKGQSQSANCVSNLRQIGIACQTYAAGNDGRPPAPLDILKPGNYENRTVWETGSTGAVGLGLLQYEGLLGATRGVAVQGANRSRVYHCPAQTAINGWAYKYDNWIDYSYLLTGRYDRAVFTKAATALATDIAGGTAQQYGEPAHQDYANVLYCDGSVSRVVYNIYSKKNRSAAVFDRDFTP